MKYLVICDSQYGFTEQYARWIAEELGCPCVARKDVKPEQLQKYDGLIYGGGLYAGGVSGLKWFAKQLALAKEMSLPVVIHSREAAEDTIDIMRAEKAGETGGVIHCYSYSRETARRFLDMGFYFGIGGVLTFKNAKKLKEAAKYIPLDYIVLETDCPYLAPEPNRGKRNSSLNLPYVAAALAQLKGVSEEEVRRAAWENGMRLYRMEQSATC